LGGEDLLRLTISRTQWPSLGRKLKTNGIEVGFANYSRRFLNGIRDNYFEVDNMKVKL